MEKEEIIDPSLELQGLDTPLFRSMMMDTMALNDGMALLAGTRVLVSEGRFNTHYYRAYATVNGDYIDWQLEMHETGGEIGRLKIDFTVPVGYELVGGADGITARAYNNEPGSSRTYDIETKRFYPANQTASISTSSQSWVDIWLFLIPLEKTNGVLEVKFRTVKTDFTKDQAVLNFTPMMDRPTLPDQSVNATATVPHYSPKGTLNINLTDGTNPLQGTFSITDSTGKLIGNYTTTNGNINQILPTETYTIKQFNTILSGHLSDPNPTRTVTITENGMITVNFINRKIIYAPISVNLKDSNGGAAIPGALFYLYDENNNVILRETTDINGDITFQSPNNGFESGKKYKISQSTYMGKYLPDSHPNGEMVIDSLPVGGITANFTNKLSGVHIPVNILNPDDTAYNLLAGKNIVLRLIDGFGNIAETKTLTGPLSPATTTFENIKPGNYTVVMLNIDDESKIISDPQTVAVDSTTATPSPVNLKLKTAATNDVLIKFVDEQGVPITRSGIRIMIGNLDTYGNFNPIQDSIENSGDSLTNANGEYNTNNLETPLNTGQSYLIRPGYQDAGVIDDYHLFGEINYTVKGSTNETLIIKLVKKQPDTSPNSRVRVELVETGNTTKKLTGGRFILENLMGDLSYIGTTDADGEIYFNSLPAGNYTLRQVAKPEDYLLDTKVVNITIPTSGGTTITHTFNNTHVTPVVQTVLQTIEPVYSYNGTGVDLGTYPIPYHQTNGGMDPNALYRNRDNKDDGRVAPNYSIPAYSTYRGLGANLTADRDVIEDDKAYLWKTATPTGTAGEYFIDLVVEGKKHEPPPTKDIILVLDNSASMSTESDGIQRITKLNESVTQFINNVDFETANVNIGMVNYATDIINDQALTKNANALLSKVPTQAQDGASGGPGGTFTQKALLRAEELLRTSTAQEKVIILVSDGAPTFSYNLNNLGTTTDVNITPDYGNVAKIEGEKSILGTGAANYLYAQDAANGVVNVDADDPHQSYLTLSDGLIVKEILNHNIATVSEAMSIKNMGIDIYAIGVELDVNLVSTSNTPYYPGGAHETVNGLRFVTKAESEANLRKISSGDEYYFDVDNADKLTAALMSLIPTDKTVINGKVTDPMGSQIILSNKDNFSQTTPLDTHLVNGDYFLEASSPNLLQNQGQPIIPILDANNTITLDGLNLGYHEWVRIRYRVNLRTEDPNFQEKFYLTNGENTLLQPVRTNTETYAFGVPAIKLPLIDITINKAWEGYNPQPTEAVFTLQRRVEQGEWETVQTNILVNAGNNWTVNIADLIQYNNSGQEFEYQVVETSPNDKPTIEVVKTEDGFTFNVINKAEKGHLYVYKTNELGEPLPSEAKFGLYQEDKTTLVKEVTVDEQGIAKFEYLENGTYYLKETVAPSGYISNDEWIKVTVS